MSMSSKFYSSKDEIETEKLRCWLEINLSYLKNNIENIRNIISDNLDIICVVKANGYGLGAVNIAKYLSSIGIKYFAVATLEEALELRNSGVTKEEITAIITHATMYVGWPKGWAVFRLAKEVWKDEKES